MKYALVTDQTKQLVSLDGKILWHHDEAELRFLFPRTRTTRLPADLDDPQYLLPLTEHPDIKRNVRFPLAANMDQFRTRSMAGAR